MNIITGNKDDYQKKFVVVPLKEIAIIKDAQRGEFYFNPNCKAAHPRIATLHPNYIYNVPEEDDCEI